MVDIIKMASVRVVNDKFMRGDAISDEDLEMLIEFYETLEWSLNIMGEEYNLARKPVERLWNILLRYKEHRKNK